MMKPLLTCLLVLLFVFPTQAQDELSLLVEPSTLTFFVGDTVAVTAQVVDADGLVQEAPVVFFARPRRWVQVQQEEGTSTAHVSASKPGSYSLIVLKPDASGNPLRVDVPIEVAYMPLETLTFADPAAPVYTGTTTPYSVQAFDQLDFEIPDTEVMLSSSDPTLATVDAFGHVTAHQPGTVILTAEADGVRSERTIEILANPVARLDLSGAQIEARTGDVIPFTATAYDADGQAVEDAPVSFAVSGMADEDALGATAMIDEQGRFVAEAPGLYTVKAVSGPFHARAAVRIVPRDVAQEIELVGHGMVSDVHTSDLWVWEGTNGRDYAITGTWGGNGEAYFWDVTDPAQMVAIDTVTVDARTVNDVKVSEDGRIAVISREGASNRRNGIVILDVSDPFEVKQLAEFTENLTGGVHNLYIYQDHVFALSAGQRYDIINIEDPTNPYKVSEFELDTPGHAIHDVWVMDGIAYSSNWSDGVQLVDVGNGIAGGSLENPVPFSSYAYPSGWNHAAFPYTDPVTGKRYVIAGDEAFPYGLYTEDRPTQAAGYLHFIDFTDLENPKEVARFEVPNAGTHNFWVEGDTLYVAYYNAGMRVVDLSGDLMGDLYKQGREIARYVPTSKDGKIPNAPMTWGPQPHKGVIFMTDWNSGLWSVRLKAKEQEKKTDS